MMSEPALRIWPSVLERQKRRRRQSAIGIIETLTAYVRRCTPWPPRQVLYRPTAATEQTEAQIRPATDIQHRPRRGDETAREQDKAAGRRLNLRRRTYEAPTPRDAHLEGAILYGGHRKNQRISGLARLARYRIARNRAAIGFSLVDFHSIAHTPGRFANSSFSCLRSAADLYQRSSKTHSPGSRGDQCVAGQT